MHNFQKRRLHPTTECIKGLGLGYDIYIYIYIYVIYIYIYVIYIIYLYTNLPVNAIVKLPHPWSGNIQGQEILLATTADN